VQIFANKAFLRFAKKTGIGDAALCEAIRNAERGLIAADLGGGVIKQRIASEGQGKSGGFRTLIVFRAGARASSFTASRRTRKTTSPGTSWSPSGSSHPNCRPMTTGPSRERLGPEC
jgi:hypothetical protein